MITRLEIATRPELQDPRGREVAHRVRSFLGIPVADVRTREVYRIDSELSAVERERVLRELVDPVLQRGALGRLEGDAFDVAVGVAYKPGVTDPIGKSARIAIEDTLGRELDPGSAVYSSRLYLLQGVNRAQAERVARELLANAVIQTIELQTADEWRDSAPDLSVPKVTPHPPPRVETVDLSGNDAELLRISREGLLALTLEEMRTIRDHFAGAAVDDRRLAVGLGAYPTDVELECVAQTWSEHCKHKIFHARIAYREDEGEIERIESLFGTYIRGATESIDRELQESEGGSWLVSVFHDNAGAVAFDERVHLVYKVETHNSPSALDPYGGAITGIVGVNRDPFGTGLGCDLLANVWGYCFASPDYDGPLPRGLMHPRRIRDGVHEGVIDGGNQSGIPYGRGWELFDGRYLGKPLVFCGTVGVMPVDVAGRPGESKWATPGDRIVMTGGRIGADGIHGATFSSAALDESAPVQAVQIGDPITQKRMLDFLLEARDLGLYNSITDNGAGGLSSSVGEMATGPGGAHLDLERAPLKYEGLAPWEILVSEAQERMTLAVPPETLERFLELARRRGVEATVLGEFTDDGFFHVTYGDRTVAHLSMKFLHDGAPRLELEAQWSRPRFDEPPEREPGALDALVLEMLSRINTGSGESKARHYDHEVKGLTVVKPFIGVDRDVPAEGTVFLARHGSLRGFVLSEGVHPFYSDIDTRAMARVAVDEAVRRQLCAGAGLDRIALLDNFCWPDPVQSETVPDGRYKLAQLVRACRGLYEATQAYRAPLISGKDSMKNDSTMGGVKISVPPTLLVSAIGQIDDVTRSITLEPKAAGDVVFLLGSTGEDTGGSEYFRMLGERDGLVPEPGEPQGYVGNRVPDVDFGATVPLYRALAEAGRRGWVRSAATPSRGGWGLTFARCVIAAGLGLEIDVAPCLGDRGLRPDLFLFSESAGRFVVTVSAEQADAFAELLDGMPCWRVGVVRAEPRLVLGAGEAGWLALNAEALARAFKKGLADA